MDEEMNYIGVGRRLGAQIVDGIIGFVVFFIVGSLVAIPYEGFSPSGFQLSGTPAAIAGGGVGLIMFLYFVVLEAKGGQTLGKKALGIKVVQEDGRSCNTKASFIRNILRIIDGIFVYLIGAILIWTSDKNQRLGDRVGNTIVIKK